jgi:hypothetical protein
MPNLPKAATWTDRNGVVWPSRKLLDPHYPGKGGGQALRRSWAEAHPGEPWPHATVCWPTLTRVKVEVSDADAPRVPGRIRMIRLPDGTTFFHPSDARAFESDQGPDEERIDYREGEWLTPGLYQLKDGRLAGSTAYLLDWQQREYGREVVAETYWYKWRKKAVCTDLADHVNAWTVPAPKDSTREACTVFDLAQAKQIIKRRVDAEERKKIPAHPDVKFLDETGERVKDPKFGECVTDSLAAELFDRPLSFAGRCRRPGLSHHADGDVSDGYPHPALDPRVNGGRAKSLLLAPLKFTQGTKPKYFTCLNDLKKIVRWEDSRLARIDRVYSKNPETQEFRQWLYVQYRLLKKRPRSDVHAQAKQKFPTLTPDDEANVTNYCNLFANDNGLPKEPTDEEIPVILDLLSRSIN